MALSSRLRLPASSGPPTGAAHQVFWVLRVGFTVLPILFGLFLAALALTRLAAALHAGQPRRPRLTGHRS